MARSAKRLEFHMRQSTILAIVLGLNVALSAGLLLAGLAADSSSLVANAVDNASDAAVYGISLVAIGRSTAWKRGAATASAIMLVVFAVGVLLDVGRRYLTGSEPIGTAMMALALVAAVVNLVCFVLLRRSRGVDVNIHAAETFSVNDFVSNAGVLAAGVLVTWTGWRSPDLVVGVAVAAIAIYGAISIARDVRTDLSAR